MKKLLPFIIVVIIIGLMVAVFWQFNKTNENTDSPNEIPAQFPTTVDEVLPSTFTPSEYTTESGTNIITRDFKSLKKIEKVGESFYNLNGADPLVNLPYSILYSENDHSYIISLEQTPIEETRVRASEDFQILVGLKEEDACRLNVLVAVPYEIDPGLSGRDLKLSYCK